MIGVLSKTDEAELVSEFFQLFKTPWEFFREGHIYDVVIATRNQIPDVNAKLLVVCSSEEVNMDTKESIELLSKHSDVPLEYSGIRIPVCKEVATFGGPGRPIIKIDGTSRITGIRITKPHMHVIRAGFDLFQEVSFLLTRGQNPQNALSPTLEKFISMLRNWILEAGVPVVEIPPVPAGYKFIACLTHDVDFIKIRQHRFDHTFWGFLYRALISSIVGVLKHRLSLHKLLKNYGAVLSLPFVYLGLSRDFWLEFEKYVMIQNGLKSTFFIIPFKNRIGEKVFMQNSERRATRYDISDIKDIVQKLLQDGFEIGLHGIDSWHSIELAHQEFERIAEIANNSSIGLRMHWLCFDEYSPRILDDAGFSYDSTFGYNETVGFRAGTTQVFRPIGVRNLLELPLNIQDVALLSSDHKGLTESEAWELCKKVFDSATEYGGVLTILWHVRSLAPERLWDDFYVMILEELKKRNVWFATAAQAIGWFRMRRAVDFENISFCKNKLHLQLNFCGLELLPKMLIRIHLPPKTISISNEQKQSFLDIPWNGQREIEISLDSEMALSHA